MSCIGRANRAVAQYEGTLIGIPKAYELLSPLTTQEAVLSSRIEGTAATLSDVLQFEAGLNPEEESRRQDIGEIRNYRGAMDFAISQIDHKPFGLNLLLELHSQLLDSVRGRDKGRGRLRTSQNWIGTFGATIEQAEYVPPDPLQLPDLLDNWEKYYHMDRPDPLVQLAVVHAQFEMIHPFLDGNGRLGRMLVPLFLYEKKLLAKPLFYISGYFDEHREEYLARLRAISEHQEWNDWVTFFLNAVEEQARHNSATVKSMVDLYGKMKHRVIELTHSQFAVPLLDLFFERPILSTTELKQHKNTPSAPMLSALLNKLQQDGILSIVRQGGGRRPSVYAFRELLNLAEGRNVV